jgi:hypothetical protein
MRIVAVAVSLVLFGACASNTSDSSADATTTTAPVLPEGACVARMSLPNPGQGGSETAIIDSHFASAAAVLTAHYKSKDSTYSGTVDGRRHAQIDFSIGQPTAGYPVAVDVTVGSGAQKESCQTSFTPH